jgi:phenylacetate-CoA ligase
MDNFEDIKKGAKLFSDGQIGEAEAIFDSIITKQPDNYNALNNLGVIHHHRGNRATAEKYFLKAVNLKKDYIDGCLNLAQLYIEDNKLAKACFYLEKVTEKNPNKNIYKVLHQLHSELGNFQKAQVYLDKSKKSQFEIESGFKPNQSERHQYVKPHGKANPKPLNILFVQDAPCIRNYKMATALRSRGHRVSLAYTTKCLSESYAGLSDDTYDRSIRLTSYRHLWEITKNYDFVHCHNEPDTLTVAALAGDAPVIHDTHDLISLRDTHDPNTSYFEGIANRAAAGRVYSTPYQRDEAKTMYGVDGPSLIFYNYASESDLSEIRLAKLSHRDNEVHIVYEGGVGGSAHRDFTGLFIELANNNIHIHVYPASFNQEQEQFFSKYPKIHYYQPVSPKQIVETMTQYDYGIIPFNIQNGNKRFLDSTIANKLFEYLAAGLPVITSDLKSYVDFFSKNPVGIAFHCADDILKNITRLQEIACKTDFSKYVSTYESEIEKLERFYIEIQKSYEKSSSIGNTTNHTSKMVNKCLICKSSAISVMENLDEINLIFCSDCETYFIDPQPNQEFINNWYSEIEKKKRWKNDLSQAIKANHKVNEIYYEIYFRALEKNYNLDGKGSVLEIGCYDGLFLKKFADLGYNCKGIDLNEGFVKYGIEHYGLDLEYGNIFQFQFPDNSFDLIIFNQVLEHLIDPFNFLKEVYRILKPSGAIFLSVPNTESILLKAEKSFLKGYQKPGFLDFPSHLFYFSKKSLQIMLNEIGFKNIYLQEFSSPTSTTEILKKQEADDESLVASRDHLKTYYKFSTWEEIEPHISKAVLNAVYKEVELLFNISNPSIGLIAIGKKNAIKDSKHISSDNRPSHTVVKKNKPIMPIPVNLIKGHTLFRPLLDLNKTQWLTTEQLLEIQNMFLGSLIKEIYNNVPFYRKIMDEVGVVPQKVQTITDLKLMPIIDKQTLQNNYKNIFNSDLDELEKSYTATGGSTGNTLKYMISPEVQYYGLGCRNRGFKWAGFDENKDKVAYLAGGSLGVTATIEIEGNKLKIPATGITSKSVMDTYFEALIKFRPEHMRAYPSALYQFCSYLEEHCKSLKLKSVVTTAETLFDYQREFIEKVLSCKIFNEYGAYDGGAGAFECEQHTGLHLQMERGIIELLDENGNTVKPGKVGRVIVTDLHNYVFPFIRYDVGDIAIASEEQCICGRGLKLIQGINGRSSDYIILKDKTKLSGVAIIHLFNKLLQENQIDILQYQVIQKSDHSIQILVIPGNNYKHENIKKIQKIFQIHLKGLKVSVEKASNINRTPAGKTRFVYSEIETAKINEAHTISCSTIAKPKICHIGGAHSVHVADLVKELDNMGYSQCVISYFPEDKSITPSHVPVYFFPYRNYQNPDWQRNNMEHKLSQFLEQIFERERPDIVHGHSLTYSCIPIWLSKTKYNLPTAIFPWSLDSIKNPNEIANHYEKLCIENVDTIFHALPNVFKKFNQFYGVIPEEKHVPFIGVALDFSCFNKIRKISKSPRILSARMMGDVYRQDLLVQAMPELIYRFPDLKVTFLIGHNEAQGRPFFNKMMDLSKKLNVMDHCEFVPNSLDKSQFSDMIYEHNIIYSLASHDTGFSATSILSAYTGAITIVQDIEEIKGILENDENVLTTALDVDPLTDVISYAIENIENLQSRFIKNNKFLEKYSIKNQMDLLGKTYTDMSKIK